MAEFDDDLSEMDEPYEDIVAVIAMLHAASELLRGHPIANDLTSIQNGLNEQRLRLLGNGIERPFWVSDIVATPTTQGDR